jgi:ribonuclease VapC
VKPAVRVLDSFSVIAYLEGEEGADRMIEIFGIARDSSRALLLSVVNWGEVYYIILRETEKERAEQVAHIISTLPIQIVPVDLEAAKVAAEFKATRKMSYADCFAAALARMRHAELVTGDRDFKMVEGEVKILWIR